MSTGSSCEFLFVQNYGSFFNWSGCVSALRDTKKMLEKDMESKTKEELDKWPLKERKHIKDFVRHNKVKHEEEKMKKLRCPCDLCQKVYNRIQILLVGPNKLIPLETIKSVEASEPWWILLKMNLPVSNDMTARTARIGDCDLKWMCKILQRCSLFTDYDETELCEIIGIRNALIHSGSNEISDEIKQKYISKMERFLSEISNSINFDKYRGENKSRFTFRFDDCDELQNSLSAQMKAIKNDIQELEKKGLNTVDLNTIKTIIKTNRDIVNDKKALEKREVTLIEAVARGAFEGAKCIGGGVVGASVGSVVGGAGADVAGRVKRFLDNN